MKKFLPIALLAALFLFPFSAEAQTKRLYFAGYAGLSLNSDVDFSEPTTPSSGTYEADNSFNFAGALGLRFNRNFRMEAELSYRGSDIPAANVNGTGNVPLNGQLDSTVLLINGYYDFNIRDWKTQPYVTAGLGVGRHAADITDPGAFTQSVDDTTYNLMWNVGTGVKYRVKDNLAWTAGYRYLDGSDIDVGGTDLSFSSHEIRIGLEWDLAYE
jgi:opacity protein-like surface antigen